MYSRLVCDPRFSLVHDDGHGLRNYVIFSLQNLGFSFLIGAVFPIFAYTFHTFAQTRSTWAWS